MKKLILSMLMCMLFAFTLTMVSGSSHAVKMDHPISLSIEKTIAPVAIVAINPCAPILDFGKGHAIELIYSYPSALYTFDDSPGLGIKKKDKLHLDIELPEPFSYSYIADLSYRLQYGVGCKGTPCKISLSYKNPPSSIIFNRI